MAQPSAADDDLAREIGERLVPEITADQIIPAAAVLDVLGDTSPARPDNVS